MPDFDVNELLAHAQRLQEQMKEAQERLAKKEVVGTSGGGMVIVTEIGRASCRERV